MWKKYRVNLSYRSQSDTQCCGSELVSGSCFLPQCGSGSREPSQCGSSPDFAVTKSWLFRWKNILFVRKSVTKHTYVSIIAFSLGWKSGLPCICSFRQFSLYWIRIRIQECQINCGSMQIRIRIHIRLQLCTWSYHTGTVLMMYSILKTKHLSLFVKFWFF